MNYTILGRTGLKASVMGLGCGGPSRLGQGKGIFEAESIAIVRQALNAGVNFIDTAERYGTEEIVGKAIKGVNRSSIIISTKKGAERSITPTKIQMGLESSLKRLGTDYIDIFSLHTALLHHYDYLVSKILPTLQRLRDDGKIRFIGITEAYGWDPKHDMLQRALQDDVWDVIMVGFNILNQSARDRVLAKATEKKIGVVVMRAARYAFCNSERLTKLIQELIKKKQINPSDIDQNNPLGFLISKYVAVSLTDAAYRFCLGEPGVHVILSGTGDSSHLRENIKSFSRPSLPPETVSKLKYIFRNVNPAMTVEPRSRPSVRRKISFELRSILRTVRG